MRMRYFEPRKGRIEIIPMIDVMLFLLVFFIIVTLQMIPDAGVNMQLPQSSQAQHLPHPKVTVNLLSDGTIRVKGAVLDAAGLTALLAADGDPAKTAVTIAADRKVAFQHFITVMDAARAAGVSDIGVAAHLVPAAAASAVPAQAAAPTTPPPAPISAAAPAPTTTSAPAPKP